MKSYLKSQFRLSMFNLEHENPSDFYLSCWQKSRTSLPFLCLRLLLFLMCVGILIASLVMLGRAFNNLGLWFIYLTDWGVLLITITTGLATMVSYQAYFKGPMGKYINSIEYLLKITSFVIFIVDYSAIQINWDKIKFRPGLKKCYIIRKAWMYLNYPNTKW